ncbi:MULTISPECIES: PH domain-containing protein [Streptomyces]|uniref:PH domain-containing protein n=1 Tax=Streptomyces TaxID=1883 RepID=UPI0029AA597B|nr:MULTISPECIES: PH domain-containing protein [unclassified Streptomyces]MDX3365744.1 PH domain-containing protein [Streptomyces sp. ME02-6987-2C]MDX3425689.1 PH domain-containing protein [Streptomyces sp. ME02-6985-2c]WTE19996.1 PH domain-containing protein [Streptomyces anthocyanicus]
MTVGQEVSVRSPRRRPLWVCVGVGAAGAVLAAGRLVYSGAFADWWVGGGLLAALVGVAFLHGVTLEVGADAYGVRYGSLLRRHRSMPWDDIADLRVHIQYGRHGEEYFRVGVLLRDGRTRRLPLPVSGSRDDRPDFDATLDALRALHRRHGNPESDHLAVISRRTAGRGAAGPLFLCLLLLAGAGLAAWFVPVTGAAKEAWDSAVPCAAGTASAERGACLTTRPAVIARTEVGRAKQPSRLYFTDGRPVDRLTVSREGAQGFRAGDRVELTLWRGQVRVVAAEHHVWREHFTSAGSVAVLAAGLALAAGYPGARVLVHRRGRRLPDDEVLPSALPFAGVLVVTALWLLPFCYVHPMGPPASPGPLAWAAAGSLITLGLLVLAWRATRIRPPRAATTAPATGTTGATGAVPREAAGEDVFLAARFLESTDYNPNHFGTHVVLGDGPPAVVPHPGPGRFAARPVPAHRLTVKGVRRPRGGDGDGVPRGWQVAELDDAGEPVRLAAAPADLTRILHALGAAGAATDTGAAGLPGLPPERGPRSCLFD